MNTLLRQLEQRQQALESLQLRGQFGHPSLRRNFAWKAGSKYKLTDPGAKAESTSDSDLSATFVISTIAQDRDGDILLPEGCKPYLPAYERSPVVHYGHATGSPSHPSFPVGVAKSKSGELLVKILDGDKIISTCRFHQETEAAVQCYALVKAGVLSMASVGFIPHLAERLKQAENENLQRDEIDFSWPGYLFKVWELVEWSIVPIASNREAIRLSLDKGVDGRKLVPEIRRSLEPLAPPKVAWASGASLAPAQATSPNKTTAAIVLPKDRFASIKEASKWLHQRSWDGSVVEDAGDSWRFLQPAVLGLCDGPECRKDLDDGAYAVLVDSATETNQKDDGACGCRKENDKMKSKKLKKEMELPEEKQDAVESEETSKEESPREPLGASLIRAIKTLVEAAEPELDCHKVKRFCKNVLAKAKSLAEMKYPELDFGWKKEDEAEELEDEELGDDELDSELEEDEEEKEYDGEDLEDEDYEEDEEDLEDDEDLEDEDEEDDEEEEEEEEKPAKSAKLNDLLKAAGKVSKRIKKLLGSK